jgi:hypothetical protein
MDHAASTLTDTHHAASMLPTDIHHAASPHAPSAVAATFSIGTTTSSPSDEPTGGGLYTAGVDDCEFADTHDVSIPA